jgi:3-oxoacyl-[acyl-carrier protein] reductase
MNANLKRKIAVVTGSAGGIGKGLVRILLENSATVVIADIQDEKAKQTIEELLIIGKCRYIHTDVSSRKDVENLIKTVVDEFGKIDIFINNAGINSGKRRVNIDEFDQDEWDKIIAVDLTGAFCCSQVVSRVMIQQKFGTIINIGSVFGSVPARQQIAFVAAKGGLHNMTKAMALELAPYGITVNGVAPGSTLVTAPEDFFGKDKNSDQAKRAQGILSHIPLKRLGKVEDIANAVLFLAADETNYITGHILTVDGGWTCGYTRDF